RQECIDELRSLYGYEAPSYSTVKNWYKYNEFDRGRRSLKDEFCRSKTAVVPEIIDTVRELITQDHHVTYLQIEACLCISPTRIYSILQEHLAVKKTQQALRTIGDVSSTDVSDDEHFDLTLSQEGRNSIRDTNVLQLSTAVSSQSSLIGTMQATTEYNSRLP
ncbi:PREDICTED: uncharacterized protein LOC108967540, partial [Bactrocera latifrons]|uniref:uncharacterized protein LOC108967540 n=1 Tax=Bactrocera latifrons TaxID=174628 RepID=UPI0008DE512F